TRSGSVWSQQALLTPADAGTGSGTQGFAFSVAIEGDTLIAGTILATGAVDGTGAAYVFTRSGTVWTQQAKLSGSDSRLLDQFGHSASLSGNTAIIGAPNHRLGSGPGSLSTAGAAYVFTRSGTSWNQQSKLVSSDVAALDEFGGA